MFPAWAGSFHTSFVQATVTLRYSTMTFFLMSSLERGASNLCGMIAGKALGSPAVSQMKLVVKCFPCIQVVP